LKHGLGIYENTAEAWLEVFGGMVPLTIAKDKVFNNFIYKIYRRN
jgi:hypothetical protein